MRFLEKWWPGLPPRHCRLAYRNQKLHLVFASPSKSLTTRPQLVHIPTSTPFLSMSRSYSGQSHFKNMDEERRKRLTLCIMLRYHRVKKICLFLTSLGGPWPLHGHPWPSCRAHMHKSVGWVLNWTETSDVMSKAVALESNYLCEHLDFNAMWPKHSRTAVATAASVCPLYVRTLVGNGKGIAGIIGSFVRDVLGLVCDPRKP
jgi:hypothetical protein